MAPYSDQNPDTLSDKVAREASVVAAGVSMGLFETAGNVVHEPIQTAFDVATGVALGAVSARVKLMKLPLIAMSVLGAFELASKTQDEILEAGPAAAEIWINSNVSRETTGKLENQISDVTADASVAALSFVATGKSLAGLEKMAPNNSVARSVFGHKPISVEFPRHAITKVEGQATEIELLPFKARELDRLVSRETADMPYYAYAPGPFESYNEARSTGKRTFLEPSSVYRIAGSETQVVLPLWYDKKIDQVRSLEKSLSFPANIQNIGRLKSLRAELDAHPLSKIAKPEDILTSLAVLPDSRVMPRVTLSPYNLKIFERNVVHRDLFSQEAGKKTRSGRGLAVGYEPMQVYLQAAKIKPLRAGEQADYVLRHEWAHLAEYTNDRYMKTVNAAVALEKNGYFHRPYATANRREDQAVHLGEAILGRETKPFEDFVNAAPIRSAVYGARLKQLVANLPEESRGLFQQLYATRVGWIEANSLPRAVKMLTNLQGNIRTREGATTVLDYLKFDGTTGKFGV